MENRLFIISVPKNDAFEWSDTKDTYVKLRSNMTQKMVDCRVISTIENAELTQSPKTKKELLKERIDAWKEGYEKVTGHLGYSDVQKSVLDLANILKEFLDY